ncbi:MAG: ubiquinone-binding protein [Gammaproteobacteria bacterium RIFCSPHIGHO2_12_FULL_38_14]|nr:MAG: ubiquinone-binding protein [Gammaproteobacteria bacterium RIFCSPHIGHO2_12_FULL_38_14]
MNTLKRSAIVSYSTRQMFELVNDIEEYPRFLPWCDKSEIIKKNNEEVVAALDINWKGIHKRFTTRNRLYPFERMEINLVNGPLQRMEGIWCFQSLNTNACKVLLDLEFEFAGSFIDRFFQPVFQHIANTLVDAFCKRAVELYGSE